MTPAYIISSEALEKNARILRNVADAAGCKIVLALKGFSSWGAMDSLIPLLDGCCASGLWEAQLAARHFGKHLLTYSPAYDDDEIRELLELTDHLDFNSVSQWRRFRGLVMSHPRFKKGELRCGLRINPQYSTGHTPIYDPCVPGSRLGIVANSLVGEDLTGISGLHMHTLCEQGAEDLEKTVAAMEEKFGDLLRSPSISWLNLGGGHWITKPDYNRDLLISIVRRLKDEYQVEVWLEPGEAAVIHTGVLRCRVLDVFESEGFRHAILNVSASAHMPDVLEMPYRPDVFLVGEEGSGTAPAVALAGEFYQQAGLPSDREFTYRLGASTCLSGDVIGDFSFDRELVVGDELIFDDMSHYTMVKTTFFNGVRHPDLVLQESGGNLRLLRSFSQKDFESRLG